MIALYLAWCAAMVVGGVVLVEALFPELFR